MEKEKASNRPEKGDFIRDIIYKDLEKGKHEKIILRFPPEPNGYLHIGHAKAICLNFGLAREIPGAVCHLRFDDTNPEKEDQEFIEAIKDDIKWLGYSWGQHLYFSSDYFEKLYEYALIFIKNGLAYVDSLTPDEIRQYRGTLKEKGKESPYRNRSIEENLELFEKMKSGEFNEGECVLRAKIDMSSSNMNMRDPVIYRIKKKAHPRVQNKWNIYPMYDLTHCVSDALEHITHSLCSLEFEDHRVLYDWFLDNLPVPCHPRQIEFARLNITHTVLSKRRLLELVEKKYVEGWDDPRMPTLAGMRRRGYLPSAIKQFCQMIGLAKADSVVDFGMLEHALRQELNEKASRAMAVLNPVKVVITNYPEDKIEEMETSNNPKDESSGKRKVPFSREIFIEKNDFMEDPPRKFFRLKPDGEVRLISAYIIKFQNLIKDKKGNIKEIHCTYDPESRGGKAPDGRKIKGTIHWVCASKAVKATLRNYDRLFNAEKPGAETGDFLDDLNPCSLKINKNCVVEPSLAELNTDKRYQFVRNGYYYADPKLSAEGAPVFNQIVSLRDSWKKIKRG
ncbi:MAG: glutamine--tRNA ligase/YqeY domain fusion protein [Candidatus Muiribacteriota bacterium]